MCSLRLLRYKTRARSCPVAFTYANLMHNSPCTRRDKPSSIRDGKKTLNANLCASWWRSQSPWFYIGCLVIETVFSEVIFSFFHETPKFAFRLSESNTEIDQLYLLSNISYVSHTEKTPSVIRTRARLLFNYRLGNKSNTVANYFILTNILL